MTIKAILLDLDGTLLPLDLKTFQFTSGRLFAEKMTVHGYDAEELAKANWTATLAMSANDGSRLNAEVYFDKMTEIYGPSVKKDFDLFRSFYSGELPGVSLH